MDCQIKFDSWKNEFEKRFPFLVGNVFEKRIRKTISKFEETFLKETNLIFQETNLINENKRNALDISRNDLKIKRLRKNGYQK